MSKLGIGVIGLGRMGRFYGNFVASQIEDARLTAVSDAQESVLSSYSAWAHLDIAAVAMGSVANETNQSWGSGWGVRLLDRLVRDHYEG